MGKQTVIRINPFITIVFLLFYLYLAYILWQPLYDNYRIYKAPLIQEEGQYYIICYSRYEPCSSFDKKTIDRIKSKYQNYVTYLKTFDPYYVMNLLKREDFNFMEFEEASRYYSALERAKMTKSITKQYLRDDIVLFLLINLVIPPLFILFWWKNYIKINDDLVTVSLFIINLFINMKTEFNIKKVEIINVITLTPLIPMRTNIEQINWRDLVMIIYRDDLGSLGSVAIPLFIFPGFKKVVKKIVEINPEVKVNFFKKESLYSV
jgi:hypothetical protein